jgi:anti-sigma B factor antagonist
MASTAGGLAAGVLRVAVDTGTPARATVRVVGEMDMLTVPQLGRALDELLDRGRRTVEVDLSGVTFLAASGLAVLAEWDERFRELSASLVLVAPTPAIVRVLRLTALDEVLIVREAGSE